MTDTPALDLYSRTCARSATKVIAAYSTSFNAAVKLLGRRHRDHVRNIYAFVRIADELVDGVATEAGLSADEQRQELDALEAQTARALEQGFSTNPVVHAFARTARECGIDETLIGPFFASMRTDISEASLGEAMKSYDTDEHAEYVYGSAEVIGLMCMRVFTRAETFTEAERERMVRGARSLGAAFQNINFLRDLSDDSERLGRDYLGAQQCLTETQRAEWITIIKAQLTDARQTLPLLPKDARRSVRCALDLFAALTRKLNRVPAAELYVRRVRIPDPVKLMLLARASTRTILERA